MTVPTRAPSLRIGCLAVPAASPGTTFTPRWMPKNPKRRECADSSHAHTPIEKREDFTNKIDFQRPIDLERIPIHEAAHAVVWSHSSLLPALKGGKCHGEELAELGDGALMQAPLRQKPEVNVRCLDGRTVA